MSLMWQLYQQTLQMLMRGINNIALFQLKHYLFSREDIYLSGGIVFVSTRILVIDLLKKRLPIEKITGIVVFRAHTMFESCQEALVLRLYRQNNKVSILLFFYLYFNKNIF